MTSKNIHIAADEKISPDLSYLRENAVPASFADPEDEEGKLALDIYETENDLIFIAPMAGVDPTKVKVELSDDVLSIAGERLFPDHIFSEEKNVFLEECYWGKFSRSIILPAAVNSNDISAKYVNGLLIIEVPKAKKAKSKVVPVQVL